MCDTRVVYRTVVLSCEFTNFRGAIHHAVLQMFHSCKYISCASESLREHSTQYTVYTYLYCT